MIASTMFTLGFIAIATGLFYIFLIWNYDYWKKRGVKGPKPTAYYGSFPGFVTYKNHLADDMREIYKQFHRDEDFVGVFNLRTPILLVTNPELALQVLVMDFKSFHDHEFSTWVDEKNDRFLANNPSMLQGEVWKERRQEIALGLSTKKIKAVYPVIKKNCTLLVDYLRNKCKASDANEIDAKYLSLRFTTEVVTDCVLGLSAQNFTENPTPIIGLIKKLFEETRFFTVYGILVGLWPKLKRFRKVKFFTKESEVFFDNLVKTAVEMRRKNIVDHADRGDFLNFLLQLQEKKNITNDQLTAHAITFFIDGFETSASVITVVLYQLAKSPNAQEKLRKEILTSLNEEGEFDFEKLHEMSYLDQCFNEAMRIIPPLLFSQRICTEPIMLTNKNGNKLNLKLNDIAMIPVFAFHHDEQYFPEPNKFIPERFDPENGGIKKFREMGVFYPFGDGPRICIGMKFGMTQTKAAVAEIVRNFNIKLNPRTRTDNCLHPTFFIGSLKGGVWLDFEELKD